MRVDIDDDEDDYCYDDDGDLIVVHYVLIIMTTTRMTMIAMTRMMVTTFFKSNGIQFIHHSKVFNTPSTFNLIKIDDDELSHITPLPPGNQIIDNYNHHHR